MDLNADRLGSSARKVQSAQFFYFSDIEKAGGISYETEF